jgi:hypothetical protein
MLDPCEWARRCRALSKSATDPEVIERLRVWAIEFANAAKEATRCVYAQTRKKASSSRRGIVGGLRSHRTPT